VEPAVYVIVGVAVVVIVAAVAWCRRGPIKAPPPAAERRPPMESRESDPAILPLLEELDELRDVLTAQYARYTDHNDRRYQAFVKRISAALVIVVVGLSVTLGLVLRGNAQTSKVAEANRATLADSQQGRGQVAQILCDVDNDQNGTLRELIVGGAKGSKPFDRIYRQFGFPPYRVRLRQAQKSAAKLPKIDCEVLVAKSRAGIAQPQPGPVFVQP
jgi:hypothetical protein